MWQSGWIFVLCWSVAAENDYDYYEYDYDYDYDYDFTDEEHCIDRDQMVLLCNGINCIREPYSNETCLQCTDECNG